ncbi:Uncharacterised protein [Delftia tsuruhatensis]|uniref:hypothetical protein n=1 Tax=Delftia tsuruhatensis TaxID=180282 RepID=UPI001E7AB31D|nr:hypothetical protein [Delftia tsuruhatensis]CAB5711457.1 Uncharacterised protein [Delftia tsuruhatensis]CAC9686798.1 Uncharacterised protein [Delftia tsuruhatensis]
MKKLLTATAVVFAFTAGLPPLHAQVAKAASEAADAADHKVQEKRAEARAKDSGPVGKAVNNVKSDYHKKRSRQSAENAKESLKKAAE